MNFDNIKKSVLTNKLTKPIVVLIFCLIMVYYLRLFFTVGIAYEGQFLKKVTSADERIYTGSNEEGDIRITVQGIKNQDRSADVIYQLPDSYQYYTVWFKDASHWDAGIESIVTVQPPVPRGVLCNKTQDSHARNDAKHHFCAQIVAMKPYG